MYGINAYIEVVVGVNVGVYGIQYMECLGRLDVLELFSQSSQFSG